MVQTQKPPPVAARIAGGAKEFGKGLASGFQIVIARILGLAILLVGLGVIAAAVIVAGGAILSVVAVVAAFVIVAVIIGAFVK